jgi:hypothetical protein
MALYNANGFECDENGDVFYFKEDGEGGQTTKNEVYHYYKTNSGDLIDADTLGDSMDRSNALRLDDGHPTVISLAKGACLWEKAITPPGFDGGGANETTTMHNVQWRTNSPKHLRTSTDISFTAAYAVGGFTSLRQQINKNQVITLKFGDGSILSMWGWLNGFAPGEVAEGTQPTASCTIMASNQDNSGKEMKPAYAAGTSSTYDSETGKSWQMYYNQVGETTLGNVTAFNPVNLSWATVNAKRCELYQRIREDRENPKIFDNLRNSIETLRLYHDFDITNVRQKIRDYFHV